MPQRAGGVYGLLYTKAMRQRRAVAELQEFPPAAVVEIFAAVYQLVRVRVRLAQLSSFQAAEQ